ncbi:MAG: GDSL family lipase [Anaerolineae bacterium]|nr:GDSL family lipase [Anaerolineae bacterium]
MEQPDLSAGELVDASTPAERTDEHFIERHATFLRRIKDGPIGVLFLGDSITRRWVEAPELWEHYFGDYQPANFGVGGDAIQNLLWRILNGEIDGIHPRVIVLLIGTNNVPTHTGAEIAAAVGKVVDTLQEKLPETRILLVAIFPRGPQNRDDANADNPYYMDVVNAANSELVKLDNGDTIRVLDIGSSLIGPDGNIIAELMPDQLHLVEPGYKVWAEAMKGLLQDMMA